MTLAKLINIIYKQKCYLQNDFSLFSVVENMRSISTLTSMCTSTLIENGFQLVLRKQAKLFFNWKPRKLSHQSLFFNRITVTEAISQKQRVRIFDIKLDVKEQLKKKKTLNKVNKTIEHIRKLQNVISLPSILAIYNIILRTFAIMKTK